MTPMWSWKRLPKLCILILKRMRINFTEDYVNLKWFREWASAWISHLSSAGTQGSTHLVLLEVWPDRREGRDHILLGVCSSTWVLKVCGSLLPKLQRYMLWKPFYSKMFLKHEVRGPEEEGALFFWKERRFQHPLTEYALWNSWNK